jgi:Uma2 family endonuclease
MKTSMTACRLITAEDLLSDPTNYEFGELWDGVWQVGEPSGGSAEYFGQKLAARLCMVAEERRLGRVTGSQQGFYVRRNPDRVLVPDIAFTSLTRLPKLPERGFIECAPNFAVEVVSPTGRWDATLTKAGVWVGHGAEVAWVVDPKTRRVAVLRAGAPLEIVEGDGVASAEPAVPGFSIALPDLFADVG